MRQAVLLLLLLLCSLYSLCAATPTLPTQSLTNAAALQQELQLSVQHLSLQTVRRMLRDEHAPANYRSELHAPLPPQLPHALQKRETPNLAATFLNLTGQGLTAYDSQQNYQGQFELVTRLDLSHNQLSSLQLQNFTQLQQLDASNNTLTALPATSSTLVTLDLSCNHLSQLEASLSRMPQLKHLNLAHNQLCNISRQAFYSFVGLQTLLLGYNNITDIDYETFLALPNLQHLDLSHNQLSGKAIRALQGIPDLVTLSIAHNPQVGAAMQEFVASWSLKELDASGTGLCQVPAALAQSVRTLKLSHNWLKAINCGDLDSYPLLQYLDLSYSHIVSVQDDALGRLELLEVLFLDHNTLERVPNSLPTSLEHLFMQNNHILELQPQAFMGLNNLKTLDLSGNRLLYLPALTLPKLLTLNLQSSGIESVSQSIVHTLPELRDLLLEENPIRCSDLLGIAEWASPCRSPDLGQSTGRIDLKRRYVQLHNFYEHFSNNCRGTNEVADADDAGLAATMPPTCGTNSAATATTTMPSTMPKVSQKSKATNATTATATTTTTTATITTTATATIAMQSSGNNNALATAKTLGPAETTSLVQLQRQEMPGMPTATTPATATAAAAAAATTTLPTTAASGMPSLQRAATATATIAAKRTNNLASSTAPPATIATATIAPTRLAQPTNNNHVAVVAADAAAAATIAPKNISNDAPTTTAKPKGLSNVAGLATAATTEKIAADNAAANSLLKQTATTGDTFVQAKVPHKHATLQLHIKDRHLIGTPLLMHKGDNLLVDAEQLLLPGTATVADAATLDASQHQQQQQQRPEVTDKRQEEVIKSETKADQEAETSTTTTAAAAATTTTTAQLHKKKQHSLSIKKLTYSSKHHATATTTIRATTSATRLQHQHSSVNTPNAAKSQEMSTFAQLKAFVELKTEAASNTAQLLEAPQSHRHPNTHPGLMLLLACVLVILLLAGLAHVYGCGSSSNSRRQQRRPQRQFNERDTEQSFLHYQGSRSLQQQQQQQQQQSVAPLQSWHHSTRRQAPYSSPLHNLQARELQREQQKLQFYSASLADSSTTSNSNCSSGSSRSSLQDDSYYIELAPSNRSSCPIVAATTAAADSSCVPSQLPLELLSHRTSSYSCPTVAATELGGNSTATTLRSVSSKLMAPGSRRLGIW